MKIRFSLHIVDLAFWLKVYPRGDCWEWRGKRQYQGYGIQQLLGSMLFAHRYAYTLTRGSIPRHLQIDHLCNHPWCVRPSHLVATTGRNNVLRGQSPTSINSRKTHCCRGHAFTEANTIRRKYAQRGCRICKTNANRCDRVRKRTARLAAFLAAAAQKETT